MTEYPPKKLPDDPLEIPWWLDRRPGESRPSPPTGEGGSIPPNKPSTDQSHGCTLAQYAEAKKLREGFLRDLGLSEISYLGAPAVRIPYRTRDGSEGAVRFRTAIEKSNAGDNRFRWKSGSKPFLYGLWHLDPEKDAVTLVEGESDCHTLWFHGINAVGLPGAALWNEERDAHYLDGYETIYVVLEPDQGGEAVAKWLSRSSIRNRVRLVRLDQHKDPGELHINDPASFEEQWAAALSNSTPWSAYEANKFHGERTDAWQICCDLANKPKILDRFAEAVRRAGVIGEARTTKLLYLALTSRLLDRPVSLAIKGPSSGGKSHITERVLSFFPPSAYYALTAMSDRALAYSDEPLQHRFLVIYEAAGMESDIASYLIRSLLSEGCVRYEFVEKTRDGLQARMIEREGPTGLLVTTTKSGLHPENETRLLSMTVTDTKDHTRDILRALAKDKHDSIDMEPWHALQEWIERSEHEVSIPFGPCLADLVPPVAVRMRRDFTAVLNLIRAHAILQQASRKKDDQQRIIATIEDYAEVREIVADLVAEGVEATVPDTVRETVEAVENLSDGGEGVTKKSVAKYLEIDESAAWRRCQIALKKGFLRNEEDRRGRPARLVVGDPLPDEIEILPQSDSLISAMSRSRVEARSSSSTTDNLSDCPIDDESGGDATPSPQEGTARERLVL